jgi:zinc protease
MRIRLKVSLIALALTAMPVLAQTSAPTNSAQSQEQPLLQQPGKWVQDYTGRTADPTVVFGTLPNGMRYAIMRNTTPSDGVAMRLRFGSGSLQETDEQQGLAHFLEHMAFRGSKNLADGDVVKMLERLGLRFGPDTNAFTAQDQTVYMFNFPKAHSASLDTGFTLFREIGERLTLDSKLVEAEKGVILSEERVRDVPQYRMAKANFGTALAGTHAVKRWPIGTIETIKAATPERLRAYYEANYRPDNATLIIVGNIEPAKIEAEIKARFGDWKSAGKAQAFAYGVPQPSAKASEFVAEGAPDGLSLSWVRPVERRAYTEARERELVIENVAFAVLNNRLAERAAKPGSPFVGAQAFHMPDFMDSASITQIGIAAAPGKWAEALDVIIQEQRQVLAGPISAEELERAKAQTQSLYQSAAEGAGTRQNEALANSLVNTVNGDQLFTSPQQNLMLVKAVLADLTPEAAMTALRRAFSGKGPVLFRTAQKDPVGIAALEAQQEASYAKPLAARAAEVAVSWPYDNFGPEGKVVTRKLDKDLGATIVTFANGSRLVVKQTPFEKDKVHIQVALGNGRAGASPKLVHALWAADLMPIGGTGKLPATDIQRWAQSGGKLVSAQLQTGSRAFTFTATTRPADLTSQMQLLAAYSNDPGFRPELGEQLAAIGPMINGQIEASAGAVFEREIARLFGGGDTRYSQIPSQQDIAATKPEDIPALLKMELAGTADVTMVGDIDVETAISLMRSTFAAGPKRAAPRKDAVSLAMPQGRDELYIVTHGGRADQAFFGTVWSLPDYRSDPKGSYTADVVAAILEARMVETVREKLGMTYSPQVSATTSIGLPGQGYLRVSIETPPSNFDAFRALLNDQITDLATKPITPDELERARKPLVEACIKRRERNEWWATNLSDFLRAPLNRSWMLGEAQGLGSVSPADIQDFTAKFLVGRKSSVIIAKPK